MLFQSFHAVCVFFQCSLIKQTKCYSYTPAKPRAYPEVVEVGGRPLAWLQLELYHAFEGFGGFLHRLLSQLQSMICSLGFCSLLHFLSQWKVLRVLFQCGRPPPPCYFCTGNFQTHSSFGSEIAFFSDCLFQDMHLESLTISVYWYLFLWYFALSYSDKNKSWKKAHFLVNSCNLWARCLLFVMCWVYKPS